jgi:hypothetical protein
MSIAQPSQDHRRAFPDQYRHPLVGKRVQVNTGKFQTEGVVQRVVNSRFGQLAKLEDNTETFYAVAHCKEIT